MDLHAKRLHLRVKKVLKGLSFKTILLRLFFFLQIYSHFVWVRSFQHPLLKNLLNVLF